MLFGSNEVLWFAFQLFQGVSHPGELEKHLCRLKEV